MNQNPLLGTSMPLVPNVTIINLNEEKKEYTCALSGYIFAEPVVLSNGRTYERQFAVRLLQDENPIDPLTREPLDKNFIQPNWSMMKLTSIFLSKHPEFNKDVYCPNPILQLLEKSLHSSNEHLEDNLVDLMTKHPNFLQKIELDDLEQIFRFAYKNTNLSTFFAILNHIKTPVLRDIAIELMTAPIDQEQTSHPNVFYILADCKNLQDTHFDLAVNIIGIENCQKLFAQHCPGWPSVFQKFWISKEFKIGKNVLNILDDEEQIKKQLTSGFSVLCTENHEDEDDSDDVHTHNFQHLLHYMLTQYPEDDISETIGLLKNTCADHIEIMLSQNDKSSLSTNLLHYSLTQSNLENGLQLALFCSSSNVNRILLSKFEEKEVIKIPQVIGNNQIYQVKYQKHESIIEYSNLIHRCCAKNDFASALKLLHLLNTHAAQALLCPWKMQQGVHINPIIITNALQYLYLNEKSDICKEFVEKQFLAEEQLLSALSAKLASGWSIFSYATTSLKINVLQKAINVLGEEKSKELILAPVSLDTNTPAVIYNCINLALKIKMTESIAIIHLLMTTLNDKHNDLLPCPNSQEHIFVTLCSMNNAARTELILDYFDDINLLVRAYNLAIKSNNNIQLVAKNNFIKILSNRFKSILSNSPNIVDNTYELIYFAIHTYSVELLESYLSLCNCDEIKKYLVKPRQQSSGVEIEVNALTYALLYLNKQHSDSKKIIELLIDALQDKAIEAVQHPYISGKNFISALIFNHDENVFTIVINVFTKPEDLSEMIKLITSYFFLNDAANKLLNVIFSRCIALSSLNKSAAEQQKEETNRSTQPKLSEIAAASLSKTLNPPTTNVTDAVKEQTSNATDLKKEEIDISKDIRPH